MPMGSLLILDVVAKKCEVVVNEASAGGPTEAPADWKTGCSSLLRALDQALNRQPPVAHPRAVTATCCGPSTHPVAACSPPAGSHQGVRLQYVHPMVVSSSDILRALCVCSGDQAPAAEFLVRQHGQQLAAQSRQAPAANSSPVLAAVSKIDGGLRAIDCDTAVVHQVAALAPQPGLISVECVQKDTGLPSNWLPVAVVPDPEVAREVAVLEREVVAGRTPLDAALAFFTDFGRWWAYVTAPADWTGAGADAGGSPRQLMELLAGAGRQPSAADARSDAVALGTRLLAFCATRGWARTCGSLLVGLCELGVPLEYLEEQLAPPPPQDAAAAEESAAPAADLGLLHLAVLSKRPAMIDVLLELAAEVGHEWDWGAPGPQGLTPLHCAAVLDDGGAMATHMLRHVPGAADLWLSTAAEVGGATGPASPATFASRVGHAHLNDLAAQYCSAPSLVSDGSALDAVEEVPEEEEAAELGKEQQLQPEAPPRQFEFEPHDKPTVAAAAAAVAAADPLDGLGAAAAVVAAAAAQSKKALHADGGGPSAVLPASALLRRSLLTYAHPHVEDQFRQFLAASCRVIDLSSLLIYVATLAGLVVAMIRPDASSSSIAALASSTPIGSAPAPSTGQLLPVVAVNLLHILPYCVMLLAPQQYTQLREPLLAGCDVLGLLMLGLCAAHGLLGAAQATPLVGCHCSHVIFAAAVPVLQQLRLPYRIACTAAATAAHVFAVAAAGTLPLDAYLSHVLRTSGMAVAIGFFVDLRLHAQFATALRRLVAPTPANAGCDKHPHRD